MTRHPPAAPDNDEGRPSPYLGRPAEGAIVTHQPDNQVAAIAFLTPVDNGHEYQPLCQRFGVEPTPSGWGLALIATPDGERHTLFTSNVDYLRLIQTGVATGAISDAAPEPLRHDVFQWRREGWPQDWTQDGAS